MHDRPISGPGFNKDEPHLDDARLVDEVANLAQVVSLLSSKVDAMHAVVEGLMGEGSELDRRTRQIRATTRRTERQASDDLNAVKRRLSGLDRSVTELGDKLEASERRLLATIETHRYHSQEDFDQVYRALTIPVVTSSSRTTSD